MRVCAVHAKHMFPIRVIANIITFRCLGLAVASLQQTVNANRIEQQLFKCLVCKVCDTFVDLELTWITCKVMQRSNLNGSV